MHDKSGGINAFRQAIQQQKMWSTTSQWQRWHQQKLDLAIAVNVTESDLVKEMAHAMAKHGIPATVSRI